MLAPAGPAVGPPPAPLRIVLADDTPLIRALLRRSFELDPSVAVVGEAANGREAVDEVCRTHADVVLLDLAMPVMDGLQAIPEIRRRSPRTRIVVLSGFDASKMERRALALGATSYLSKGAGPDQILAAVHRAVEEPVADPLAVVEADGPVSVETAYRRQHDLVPLLTHEIGNQLTVIQGFAEMLRDGLGQLPDEIARQFADAVVRNSHQMRHLLEAVADLRRLDDGELRLDLTTFDLVPLVRQTLDDLQGQLTDRRVEVDLPPAAVVTADAVRLRQALTNLLSNAGKFTDPGAMITVGLAVDDDGVELSVADDGPGIPPGREQELFQKFSRLGARAHGTGIGLYLSRAIARAHGGDLVLAPQPVGCRFVLRLARLASTPGGRADAVLSGGRRRAGAGPTPAPTTT